MGYWHRGIDYDAGPERFARYIVPRETEHLESNLWLIGQFGARGTVERRQVVIEGLALSTGCRARLADQMG